MELRPADGRPRRESFGAEHVEIGELTEEFPARGEVGEDHVVAVVGDVFGADDVGGAVGELGI